MKENLTTKTYTIFWIRNYFKTLISLTIFFLFLFNNADKEPELYLFPLDFIAKATFADITIYFFFINIFLLFFSWGLSVSILMMFSPFPDNNSSKAIEWLWGDKSKQPTYTWILDEDKPEEPLRANKITRALFHLFLCIAPLLSMNIAFFIIFLFK